MSKYYLVDKALNVMAEGDDFDRLQDRVDAEFESLYVIGEDDYLLAMTDEPLGLELPDSLIADDKDFS